MLTTFVDVSGAAYTHLICKQWLAHEITDWAPIMWRFVIHVVLQKHHGWLANINGTRLPGAAQWAGAEYHRWISEPADKCHVADLVHVDLGFDTFSVD